MSARRAATLASVDFGPFLRRLTAAVTFAKSAGEVRRDAAARAVWAQVYPALSAGSPGLFGAATSRAEAHVLRLSVIYALLDGTVSIGVPHLLAALAVWDYCAASARWIFGERLGDPVAERILAALRSGRRASSAGTSS